MPASNEARDTRYAGLILIFNIIKLLITDSSVIGNVLALGVRH